MKNINYNEFITRESVDKESYDIKFKAVDTWLAGDRKDTATYGKFLLDPTLFAYLHQRVDGQKLKYFPYQDLIANDKHRYKYFRAANQIGKSLLLDSLAARNVIWDHGHGHNEAIVSKSLPQSTYQMRRVKSLLRTMPEIQWADVKGQTDSLSVISVDIKDSKGNVKYTNYLICAPSTEGLLGYDLHALNLDEFEFWEADLEHFFTQIAQPRTYTTKGNITIFSNPNGADNFGAELEKQILLKGGRKWHTYVFNYLDKPGNTQEEYDQLKHELSRQKFESTVAAIRSLSDRNYFAPDEIENSYDSKVREIDLIGKQSFWFLDVGAKIDQSVLCGGYIEPDEHNPLLKHIYIPIIQVYPVGYPISRVVGSETTGDDGWHYIKSTKEYLEEHKPDGISPVLGVDVTGNSGISPLFESIGIMPVDVTFSGPVKSGMYQRLKYFMEKGLMHRVKNKEFDYQFGHLVMKRSKRGYLMIHHENETDKDDVPDSVAGLVHLADGPVIRSSLALFKRKVR